MPDDKLTIAYQKAQEFVAKTPVIGIQKEKILHKTLKYYLEEDEEKHEIKINKGKSGYLYADIYDGQKIYEIQTGNFNKLRDKLAAFLPSYQVWIVYPIAHKKNIYKIDEQGLVKGPIKSPKTGRVYEAFKELYKIKSYLKDDHLHLKIFLIDVDEYRTIIPKKHFKSRGYLKEEQIPKQIVQEINLNHKEDYFKLLDLPNLAQEFTSQDLAKCAKINLAKARLTLNILAYLEVVQITGKIKNSYIYKKSDLR